MSNVVIIRYGEPSKYDHCPTGSICKVIKASINDEYDIFIQRGQETNPQWDFVGSFHFYDDNELIDNLNKLNKL